MERAMMNSANNGALRETAWQIYDYIREEFVLNRPDMTVRGVRFNSTLLLSFLTGLCQGKELIIGEPALGQTTSAEYICALL